MSADPVEPIDVEAAWALIEREILDLKANPLAPDFDERAANISQRLRALIRTIDRI